MILPEQVPDSVTLVKERPVWVVLLAVSICDVDQGRGDVAWIYAPFMPGSTRATLTMRHIVHLSDGEGEEHLHLLFFLLLDR